MARILIIDNEPHMRSIIAANLVRAGHDTSEAAGAIEGLHRIGADDYDAVFVDQRMPDGEGLDLLSRAQETDPTLSVIMLTALGTVELAVEAMRRGACDFLAKPFEPERLLAVARRAVERTALLRENYGLKREVEQLEGEADIFGSTPAIRAVRDTVARVAATNITVLILGETGSGKELVARAIHNHSARAGKPFIPVNCAAFTESLLDSELFGHEKGAFTGAERSRPGLFEAAHDGALFLDEIGEMPLAAQARLLRVLTDGQIMRVGSTQLRKVNVRVLAATHRDLETMVAEGRFRQDLYYRLAVAPITVPPLRDRREDIPLLCEILSRQIARDLGVPQRPIPRDAMALLKAYSYPGNVRELRNLVERAYILSSSGSLGPENFAIPKKAAPVSAAATDWPVRCTDCAALADAPPGFDLSDFLEQIEKTLIGNVLAATGGAQAEAARRLGLSRSVLSYKLSKYGARPGV